MIVVWFNKNFKEKISIFCRAHRRIPAWRRRRLIPGPSGR
jgi:hypothetical protein